MNIPEDLKYTKNDEWLKLDGESAIVGITDYAQDQLSDIVYLELTLADGEAGKQGEMFGTVESVKAAADLYLPASGTVTGRNVALGDTPETVNSDPYGEAWMLKMTLSEPSEVDGLMDAAAYAKYLEERDA